MSSGLSTVLNILTKWHCTPQQAINILHLQANEPFPEYLSEEQLQRVSYVLNIHTSLTTVFKDSDNIYGFMTQPNNDPCFAGHSPLELIGSGDLTALEQTCWHIDSMRVA